jgi:hypothetical protein
MGYAAAGRARLRQLAAPRQGGSLLIQLSNSPGRHCERSEAIHSVTCGKMDCFVASLLAMTVAYRVQRKAQQPYFFLSRSRKITANGLGAAAPTSFKVFVS